MELNEHHKKEYPPMHTAEHILNQTMVRMFGCERSKNTHIERKKSKCDYHLKQDPTNEQIAEIENRVNAVIAQNLPVTLALLDRTDIPAQIDLSKLPKNASRTLRLVYVGGYDSCACVGEHVENTREIGQFKIVSSSYNGGTWRVRFKLLNSPYTA